MPGREDGGEELSDRLPARINPGRGTPKDIVDSRGRVAVAGRNATDASASSL